MAADGLFYMAAMELTHYQLSTEANCLSDTNGTCYRLTKEPIEKRRHQSDLGTKWRTFARVNTHLGEVLADVVTGTIYDPKSGRCYSSTKMCIK
jgi:hypothetical protein